MSTVPQGERPPRIALYSHDTMGLGHVRRNLLIAKTLAAPPVHATVLLIAGVHEACGFSMPPGVDCLTLPAYSKDGRGAYAARSLGLEITALRTLRSETMATALASFSPDLLVVDNVPRGALEELSPVLEQLKTRTPTRCVLGMRDVLDEPGKVREQWRLARNEQAIRDYYDAIWIYGDRDIYDSVTEYGFAPDVAAKVSFTGYLDQRGRLVNGKEPNRPGADEPVRVADDLDGKDFTLCVVGGGQDGSAVVRAFAQATLPPGELGVVLTGPFLPSFDRQALKASTASNPRIKVLEFLPEPIGLMSHAKRIVAMGGYNTVLEILSLGKRALVVPRNRPRLEQTIRAQRLQALGLLDLISPDDLNPRALSDWLNADAPVTCAREIIDFSGLMRLPRLVASLLGRGDTPRPKGRLERLNGKGAEPSLAVLETPVHDMPTAVPRGRLQGES